MTKRIKVYILGNTRVTNWARSMVVEPQKAAFGTRKGNGEVVLQGVDGRSLMARRFRELTSKIEADLGGDLSEAKKVLLARGAALAVWAEEQEIALATGADFDVQTYSTACNTLRRILSDLGLKRVPREIEPSLQDYLEGKSSHG